MARPSLLARALEPANLRLAWTQVAANRGAAGADDVSVRRFARDWEARLADLSARVSAGSYRPTRLRRFSLPKPDGGLRSFAIPSVADRVLQRAALNVLEPHWERAFLDCSFGYRPRRSLKDAVRRVAWHREAGRRWVLDADIRRFFESVDHALLRQFLAESLGDERLRALIELWLTHGARPGGAAKGLPLGAVISPVLSNLYLHRFDQALARAGLSLVRYADDFIVLCGTRAETEEAQRFVAWGLADLKLELNAEKTQVTHFDDGFVFLGVHFEGDRLWYIAREKRISLKGWPLRFRLAPIPPDGYE